MQSLILVLPLIACVLAGEVGVTPKGALLVFPPSSQPDASSASRPTLEGVRKIQETVNNRSSKALSQEVGSGRGVYHVYFPDGRLQRVQYTTSPIKSSEGALSQMRPETTRADGARARSVYYVGVSEDRLRQLLGNSQQPDNQQVNQERSQSDQGADGLQTNTSGGGDNSGLEFVPLAVMTAEDFARSSQRSGTLDQTARVPDQTIVLQSDPSPGDQNKTSADQSPGVVAVVRLSDVQPITGPLYSYSKGRLIRILRFANYH